MRVQPLRWNASGSRRCPVASCGPAVNILFIGISFTQRNDLPGLLAAMSAEPDVCIQHKLISAGGASLRTHWNAGRAAEAIAGACNSIGKEVGAIVEPVGLAWHAFSQHDRPQLYDRDQSHPSPAGSWLAACVFRSALLKINPVGIEAPGAGLGK